MAISRIRVSSGFLASLGMPRDTLARRMRIALAESDMRDFEVAEAANVTAAWLGSVKQGQVKDPPIDKLRAVARVLGKATGYFTAPLGYIPIEEVENGLLVALGEEDRELLGRIVSRLDHVVETETPSRADPPPERVRPKRAARS